MAKARYAVSIVAWFAIGLVLLNGHGVTTAVSGYSAYIANPNGAEENYTNPSPIDIFFEALLVSIPTAGGLCGTYVEARGPTGATRFLVLAATEGAAVTFQVFGLLYWNYTTVLLGRFLHGCYFAALALLLPDYAGGLSPRYYSANDVMLCSFEMSKATSVFVDGLFYTEYNATNVTDRLRENNAMAARPYYILPLFGVVSVVALCIAYRLAPKDPELLMEDDGGEEEVTNELRSIYGPEAGISTEFVKARYAAPDCPEFDATTSRVLILTSFLQGLGGLPSASFVSYTILRVWFNATHMVAYVAVLCLGVLGSTAPFWPTTAPLKLLAKRHHTLVSIELCLFGLIVMFDSLGSDGSKPNVFDWIGGISFVTLIGVHPATPIYRNYFKSLIPKNNLKKVREHSGYAFLASKFASTMLLKVTMGITSRGPIVLCFTVLPALTLLSFLADTLHSIPEQLDKRSVDCCLPVRPIRRWNVSSRRSPCRRFYEQNGDTREERVESASPFPSLNRSDKPICYC